MSTDFERRVIDRARAAWPAIYGALVAAKPKGIELEAQDSPQYTIVSVSDVETLASNLHFWACQTCTAFGPRSERAMRLDKLCRWAHEMLADTEQSVALETEILAWLQPTDGCAS